MLDLGRIAPRCNSLTTTDEWVSYLIPVTGGLVLISLALSMRVYLSICMRYL